MLLFLKNIVQYQKIYIILEGPWIIDMATGKPILIQNKVKITSKCDTAVITRYKLFLNVISKLIHEWLHKIP